MTTEELELTELFLKGELDGEELKKFRQRLLQDPLFAEKVTEHKVFTEHLDFYKQRFKLKQQLDLYHADIRFDPVKESPVRRFLRTHYSTFGIAASVAVLVVAIGLFAYDYMRTVEKKQQAYYKALKRDLDDIKKTHTRIIKDIPSDGEEQPLLPAGFGATGFAISSDGYIITSYHTIKGADYVYVQNEKFRDLQARVVYNDVAHDLSVLKITDTAFTGLGVLPYRLRSPHAELGERVFILGYPREDVVYGEGSISSTSGFEGDSSSYQVSVPVNPGNSGSPLLNERGNIIGMISGKYMGSEGTSFAVKSEYIIRLVEAMPLETNAAIKLPFNNQLDRQSRPRQLKKLKDYVFIVKGYNKANPN